MTQPTFTYQDAVKRVLNNQLEESKHIASLVYGSLVTNGAASSSRLPENIFIRRFLPMFAGMLSEQERAIRMGEWISVAGTPMAEVGIFNTTPDQVIFFVPPVFDTSFIQVIRKARNGPSFKDIHVRASMIGNNIPQQANAFLAKTLGEKFNEVTNNGTVNHEVLTANEKRWMDIFARYKMKLPDFVQAKLETTVAPVNTSNLMSDEIYD